MAPQSLPTANPLFVPMSLDVLLVNQAVLKHNVFRRWKHRYDYLHTETFQSSEPEVFGQGIESGPGMATGALLHWTLPRALRASQPGSSTAYPLVPNRWLVVRLCRDDTPGQEAAPRVAKAWVVESDCPAKGDERSSFFLVNEATKAQWEQSADPRRRGAKPKPVSPLVLRPGPASQVDAAGTGAYTTRIGTATELDGWQEQDATTMFLTAVAPGNLEFSAYVPFHENVFSFHDDLHGVPATATLSYQVTGWYSDSERDIVRSGLLPKADNSAKVLAALGWELANATDQASTGLFTASLYSGTALALQWEREGEVPANDQLQDIQQQDKSPITVAVANTSVDAFSTLVAGQLSKFSDYRNPTQVIELLRAFHYDLLPLLNQPNGDAVLSERVRQEWFSSKAGGTRWVITADQAPGGTPPDATAAALTPAERTWLQELNAAQQALDAALAELHHLQWDLHATWWKAGLQQAFTSPAKFNLTGTTAAELAAALDATLPDSLLGRVLAQLETVHKLAKQVPQPAPDKGLNAQGAFLAGVAQFAASKGLERTPHLQQQKPLDGNGTGTAAKAPTGKLLKAVSLPRFWQPTNPSLLLSGVEPSAVAEPSRGLTVRRTDQLVQRYLVAATAGLTAEGLAAIIPPLHSQQPLPDGVAALYQEFFLLDPVNAPQIASHIGLSLDAVEKSLRAPNLATGGGVLPALWLTTWVQNWNPLYLEWEVSYTDVPYEYFENGQRRKNWTFNGTDYELVDKPGPVGGAQTLRGRSVLSAHTRFTFAERLKTFTKQYGSTAPDLNGLYDAIERVDAGWHFLSQDLVRFNDLLVQRDARAFRKPTTESFQYKGTTLTFEKVTGCPNTPSQPPYDTPMAGQGLVGAVPAVKMTGPSDLPFHHLRSGQAHLTHVILYDKFGRQLEVVLPNNGGAKDADKFNLVVDEALKPRNKLVEVAAPFQLPPRLLQPARLDLLPVHYQTNLPAPALDQDINPVCGWLIANHLDQGLLLYAPDGASLGELRLGPATPSRLVQWRPPLHNDDVDSVEAVAARSPELGAFVVATEGRDEADFQALLGVIDSTLWTTEPLGTRTDQHLSVLVGRPLALVRMRVQFALDGPALESCDWPKQAAKTGTRLPLFSTSTFGIRFGSLATREDGVIGYFKGHDYSVFNSVAAPELPRDYVQTIGPLGKADGNYLELPFDGRTSQLITLLADPRAVIHATTGLVPVKAFTISPLLVYPALARIELTFRVGPRLVRRQPAAATGGVPAAFAEEISCLPPSEKTGTWSWWEKTAAPARPAWQPYGLTNASLQAAFGAGPVSLRDGYLQFVAKPEPKSEPTGPATP